MPALWFPRVIKRELSGQDEAPLPSAVVLERKKVVPSSRRRAAAPTVGNNGDAGDLENEMKYELQEEQQEENKRAEQYGDGGSGVGRREEAPPGYFTVFYESSLTMAGSLINLIVIVTGFSLIGAIVCIAATNDPCGCEELLVSQLIDRDSLMVIVEEDEGERIGLLQDSMDRSDLYKTNEQAYVYIPRETNSDDEYSVII